MTIEFNYQQRKSCALDALVEKFTSVYSVMGDGVVNIGYDFHNNIWMEIPAETKFQMKLNRQNSNNVRLESISNASAVVSIDDYTYIITRQDTIT